MPDESGKQARQSRLVLIGLGELGDGGGGEEEEVGAGIVVVLDVAPARLWVDGVEALLDVVEGNVALAVGSLVEGDEEGGDERGVVAGKAVGDEVLAAGGEVAARSEEHTSE